MTAPTSPWACACAVARATGSRGWSAGAKRTSGSMSPKLASSTRAAGLSRARRSSSSAAEREIGLRHDERVGGGGLPQRLLAREAVLRVDGRDDALELVVVLDDRLGEQRVDDRRRVGEPGRLDDDASERGDLAALAPAEQVAQLVGEVAAQRAADAAALQQHRALVDPPQQVMVDADLADLVHDHRRLAHRGMAEQARDQRRLAAAEEARHERDGELAVSRQGPGRDRGRAGRAARPARRSASTHSTPRLSTTTDRPLRSRRT